MEKKYIPRVDIQQEMKTCPFKAILILLKNVMSVWVYVCVLHYTLRVIWLSLDDFQLLLMLGKLPTY